MLHWELEKIELFAKIHSGQLKEFRTNFALVRRLLFRET